MYSGTSRLTLFVDDGLQVGRYRWIKVDKVEGMRRYGTGPRCRCAWVYSLLKATLANLKRKFSHVTIIPSPEKSGLIADDNFAGS